MAKAADTAPMSVLESPPKHDLERATLPTASVSLQGDLLQASQSFRSLVRVPPGQLPGLAAVDLCRTSQDADVLAGVVRAAQAGADGGEAELRLQTQDRCGVRVRMAWSLVRDTAGAPSSLRTVWVVTGDVLPDQQPPIGSEARWQSLLEHAGDITWTADADGRISSATPRVPDQLGWQLDRLDGACAFDFVHPSDLAVFRAAWDRLVTSSSRQEVVECRVLRADGGWTWMRETLTDLRHDPNVRAIAVNVTDITRWRHDRNARARHEAHLRARFEQSGVPQATLDGRGCFAAVNDALAALVGQPAGMLLGQPVGGLNHPGDNGLVDGTLTRVLSGEQDSAQAEGMLSGQAGRAVPVLADLSLLRDEHGQPAGVALFWHDLSRLHDVEKRQRQQEEFFLALSRRANDLALVTDTRGCVLYVSPAVQHMLGYEAEELLAVDSWDFVHPDDVASARAAFAAVVDRGSSHTFEVRVRDTSGAWRCVEVTSTNLLDTAVGGIVSNLVDITDRVEAERALRASEARYRAIADTGGEGIWAMSPDGRTLYVNERMATILGLSQRQVYDSNAMTLLDPERTQQLCQRLVERAGRGSEHDELHYRHPDGDQRVLSLAATLLEDADGEVEGLLVMVSDVTDARRVEQELRHTAVHDGLTGLPNRTLLLDRLEHALERETSGTAVICIDLDHFKLVNDSRGHGAGDELLVVVARRLRSAARSSDTVARFGGDEFVVICEDVDQEAADAVARQLLAALDEPIELGFGPVHVNASVGIALSPAPSASDLLRFADTAMYSAKAAGRGRVRHFDHSLAQEAEQRYALAADLRVALADDGLSLHYQPVVELRSGRVVGIEALARWQHAEHGAVPPSMFVAVAELSGLAPDLDAWVLRHALHDAAALRAAGAVPPDAYIAVNLSARNLADPNLEELVVSAAASAGVVPSSVVLEITEGAIMDDRDVAVAVLSRLRNRGFEIAIDDFGTGYSSLAYLRDLPITILKIDRSFVAHIVEDRDARAIAASIVDLARAVGVTVVAEGVETPEQAALLERLGCRAGQGWLWSAAVAEEAISSSHAWAKPFATVDRDLGTPPRHPAELPKPATEQPKVVSQHAHQRLLALHREGASLATIAAALNREGYRTPTGVRWHSTSVARTVASSAYPTLIASNDDEPSPNN